jgi:hypothetical protein
MAREDRIAAQALAHAGCSEHHNVDRYMDIIVRESDRTPAMLPYYLHNEKLSTCALAALGCLRDAGCVEPECVAPYKFGMAVADVQSLARRFDAWVSSSPPLPPLKRGDIWIIVNDVGQNPHVGICTSDAVVSAGGASWIVETVEGGQRDEDHDDQGQKVPAGSSAILKFTRTFRQDGTKWRLGSRYILGIADGSKMPVPDDRPTLPDRPAAPPVEVV